MATIRIQRANGRHERATYVRHLRTLTGGSGQSNRDLDLYRLTDGAEIICESPDDARATPVEWPGLTIDSALFVE